ncbi:hypothetical protein BDV41DRAFT_530435 [Aspergillus transmontanensis]|uniref:Uncharacterized protein n=1 Tax=Aspergillus transmontanensis TaxID=1034304 RepID=A0A5N6W506_9EURO|nr:hypothetical protein BDV41DRAFT_530435 [Aspergillus transmontanensis]
MHHDHAHRRAVVVKGSGDLDIILDACSASTSHFTAAIWSCVRACICVCVCLKKKRVDLALLIIAEKFLKDAGVY